MQWRRGRTQPLPGKYIGTSIKGSLLENTVWSDITRCLINPADLPDELLAESNDAGAHAVVGPGGRVVIPAAYRDALGITESDAVLMRLDGEELGLTSDETEVRWVREIVSRYVPEGIGLVEEILRERRREIDTDGD